MKAYLARKLAASPGESGFSGLRSDYEKPLWVLLIMTALVHATQLGRNPAINNYADALYFTVTTLTTTGFGDITLQGTSGRLLAVMIMIFGVSLFIRLVQTLFRPQKVHYECPVCGLTRHDPDAVHCKHCGATIHIQTEGAS